MELHHLMSYPARKSGVATASKPSGAVASVLAKAGKNTTLREGFTVGRSTRSSEV